LHLLGHLGRDAGALAAVDFGLLDPVVQRLRGAADLRRNRHDRLPARRVVTLVVENQPHRALAHFRGKLVRRLAHDAPSYSGVGASGKPGAVHTLGDQNYMAIEAGPLDPFNHSFSIMVECDAQAEIDRLWSALEDGGAPEQCGWIRDRWGLCWQIAPRILGELMNHPDPAVARRVTEQMLKMVKLDIAPLEAAARG